MIFDILFIYIAKKYLQIWRNYKLWMNGVRYFIYLLFLLNIGSFLILTKMLNKITFMTICVIVFIFISNIKPHLNNRNFVISYKLTSIDNLLSCLYIVLSILLFFSLFFLYVI